MADPGSLQSLNDIVEPAAVPWWPPAPGWYAVLVLLAVLFAWGASRALKSWRMNTYRRQALRELAAVRGRGAAAAAALPALLKRTALSAWPRDEVASLTGDAWRAFLDRQVDTAVFSGTPEGEWLDRLSYAGATGLSAEEFEGLVTACSHWLRQHRAPG